MADRVPDKGVRQRKLEIFVAVVLVLGLLSSSHATASGRLEVTYLGNEGFLLADDEHSVLIDALYGDGLPGYAVVDPEIRTAIEGARPPYDRVDIILATHHHDDHFDPRAVARHLRANPRAVFLSTPQAIARMKKEVGDFASLSPRAHGVVPDEGERHSVRLLGLDLEVLNLHHGRNRKPAVENLGFLFELGGRRLLHVGDTMASASELASYGLPGVAVDVAFLPCWLVAYEPWAGTVRDGIGAAEIVVMHLPVPDAPDGYFAPFSGLGDLLDTIRRKHPGAQIFYSGSIDQMTLEGPSEASLEDPDAGS